MNCPWQLFRQQYAEYTATISNAIVSQTKHFFWIFYCIPEMCMKFRAFSKKRCISPSQIISEITDVGRRGYLNVWKVLLKNTIRKWTR